MFNYHNLDNYYSLQAPEGKGESTMNLRTGYDNSVEINVYHVNQDAKKGPLESFSIYSTGLVIFVRQTPSLIELYSNKEFNLGDDGVFHLDPA